MTTGAGASPGGAMSLSRKGKIWIAVLCIPIVLAIAGVVVLKAVFTNERLKAMIVPQAENMTGRTIAVDEISLSVFPSIALDVHGAKVSNLAAQGFSSEPFMALESLRLNVRLLPLLRSRIEVTSLIVERPMLLLEVDASGVSNYSNLTTGGKPPDPSATASAPRSDTSAGMALIVSNLQVNNGVLEYRDHGDSSVLRANGLSLSMEIGQEGNVMMFVGSAVVDSLSYGADASPLIHGVRAGFDHRILYNGATDQLQFERGKLVFQELPLVLAGTVTNVTREPVLDLTIGSDSLSIAELLSLIPGEYRQKAAGARGAGIAQMHIALTGTITDSTTADIVGVIRTAGASIQYPELPKPITDITITSDFSRTTTKQEFRIENLTARLGETPIQMAMTVTDFNDPSLDLTANGRLNLATVSEYYPLEKGTTLGGAMTIDAHVAGKVREPKALRAQGSLQFQEVTVATASLPKPIQRVNGSITLSNEVAESKKLTMIIGGSDLALAWKLKNYLSLLSDDSRAPRATATMSLESHHLSMRDISTEEPGPATAGSAQGSSKTPQRGLTLPDVEMDVKVSIGTLTTEKFEFSNVRGSVHVSNGLITMQNLNLNAFGGSVVTTGSLDLSKPGQSPFELALNVSAVQANALLSPFTSIGQRLNGALSMKTSLKGSLNDTLGLVTHLLRGGGAVAIKEGNLKGVRINQSLASALSMPDLETIQFKDWGNDFVIENGRLAIKDLTINALNAQYVVSGSQGLDGSLDYRLALYLPESAAARIKVQGFAGDAVNLFKDQSGRLKFDFTVGGSMESPKLQMDTEPARKRLEDQARQKLDAEKQKLEKQLKDKAGEALKRILKK